MQDAALTSMSGFCAPVSRGSVTPFYDAVLLRTAGGGDDPSTGKSAFFVEAEDAACLQKYIPLSILQWYHFRH